MRIVDVKANIFRPNETIFRWREDEGYRRLQHNLLRVIADDGQEGHFISQLLNPGELETGIASLRSLLIGRDPHDVEAISYKLTRALTQPSDLASAVDICLWDLIGKAHAEPIYRLLGAARHRIRAYASAMTYDTVEEYVKLALDCRDLGFNALKLHAYAVPDKDIEVCRAVRAAVGDTMDLMLDPVNAYDRRGAFRVAEALEELDFYWLEAPVYDTDMQGLTDLTRSFKLQITATESLHGGLRVYAPYVAGHVVDSIRSMGDRMGGISAMRKSAALCEAFNVNYEPHSYGTTLIQASHLHIMLAIHNCDFFELPVPQGILDDGMADVIRVTADGFVDAPVKPGLGYDLDWDAVDHLTVKQL
jgi:L-alanine-DL-glutamate epimerase-like enolase superfamily enzyme